MVSRGVRGKVRPSFLTAEAASLAETVTSHAFEFRAFRITPSISETAAPLLCDPDGETPCDTAASRETLSNVEHTSAYFARL